MFVRYLIALISSIIIVPCLAQEDDKSAISERTGEGVHVSIGLNTFPQEVIGMIEYMSKSKLSYFVGLDYGSQREIDQSTITLDDDNCYIRPARRATDTFESYSDLSVGKAMICPQGTTCLLYTSPSPRDRQKSRMPSSA